MASPHDFATNDNNSMPMKQTLFTSIASWLSDGNLGDLQLEGTDSQINALKDAMHASKDFQDELYNPRATLHSLTEKLQTKSKAAVAFEEELGMPWLL